MTTYAELKARAEAEIRDEQAAWKLFKLQVKNETANIYMSPAVKKFLRYRKQEALKNRKFLERNNNGDEDEVEIEEYNEEEFAAADEHLHNEYEDVDFIPADGRSANKSEMRIYLENGGLIDLKLGKETQTTIAAKYGKTQGSVSRMIKAIKKAKRKRQ